MSKQNIFDTVMDYIDDNIKAKDSEIKKGIYAISNYTDMDFNKFLSVLSKGKYTLYNYIYNRRMYMAVKELTDEPKKKISDIAVEYHYSDSSSFSRAIYKCYNLRPGAVRKQKFKPTDNRLHFSDFIDDRSRLDRILKAIIADQVLSGDDDNYFESFIHATDEYGFDTATCCLISELADKLKISFSYMLEACFNIAIEVPCSPDYIEPETEKSISLGIYSYNEMTDICEHYKCDVFQLNQKMVDDYRAQMQNMPKEK